MIFIVLDSSAESSWDPNTTITLFPVLHSPFSFAALTARATWFSFPFPAAIWIASTPLERVRPLTT